MKPVNNKSLVHFLFDKMEKLENGEIDEKTANAHCNLSRQVSSLLRYELERADTIMRIDKFNRETANNLMLRQAEGINFD